MTDSQAHIVDFKFGESGTLESVRLADTWAREVSLDEFGFVLLRRYAEQYGETQHLAVLEPGMADVPKSHAEEMFAEALQLIQDTRAAIRDGIAKGAPSEAEPVLVGDRERRFTLSVESGIVVRVEGDNGWLKQADVGDVEEALLEAFGRVPDSLGSQQSGISKLKERHRALVERRNDLRKG